MFQPAKPVDYYSEDYRKVGFEYYSSGHYRQRNLLFAPMIQRLKPRRVFEFCGAEGDLAEILLKTCPTIELYLHTDFCPEAVAYTRQRLKAYPQAQVKQLDIDKDYAAVCWSNFDTIISTALEHVENDVPILTSIQPHSNIALCLPNMQWEGHVRSYNGLHDILQRYGELLRIIEYMEVPISPEGICKYLLTARRKP
jgi:hypothetical protein